MATTFHLAPIPKWVLINNQGTVAGGAFLYTYSSLNFTQKKAVFQDPGGTIPWTNPIIFDLNGTQGPFYWQVDSANPNDLYHIEAYDSAGNLLFTIDNYGADSGGGGGNVTTYLPLQNYIANNQFIDHVDNLAGPLTVDQVIAPSNHKGFTPSQVPVTTTTGAVGPDIRFVKSNATSQDGISFEDFALASDPLTGDVTPAQYVRYFCNVAGSETYKAFQFPITQKVKNLANEAMTFRVWAATASGSHSIRAQTVQYFGSGTAASPTATGNIGAPMTLTTDWKLFTINFTVPSVAGKSLGTPGKQTDDDALYIQLLMPSEACEIFFIKPALYLGTIQPNQEFDDYDQIYSVTTTARTGSILLGLIHDQVTPGGYILMDDTSIGNSGSAATRKGSKYFQLYKTVYDMVPDAYAPVSGSRTGNAVNDFLADKTLTLPRALGRVLAGAGPAHAPETTAHVYGEWLGEETHQLSVTEMPNRVPVASAGIISTQAVAGGGTSNVPGALNGTGLQWTGGDADAMSLIQPTTYVAMYIKL